MTALTDEARELAKRAYSNAYDIKFALSGYIAGPHCIEAGVLAVAEVMFAAGAADMQERAAQAAAGQDGVDMALAGYHAGHDIAAAIRAIPTTPEEGN